MPRIEPVSPPYSPDVEQTLRKWMPSGFPHEPLLLFRVLQRHTGLASRMRVLGAGLLGHGELPALDREIVIARVCARSNCQYEWRVHATFFADDVGLSSEQLQATVLGEGRWSEQHTALIQAVDELHDTTQLSDETWSGLSRYYDDRQLIEILVLCGWYRTISCLANGTLVEHEPWTAAYPAASRPTATAAVLRDLHVPGKPLVLPNAWDADTARLVEAAGFPAVATSSVAVSASLGYPDGDKAPVDEMLSAAARIAAAVNVPVTVDVEGGYRLSATELVRRLFDAGAVGCNFEDTDHTAGGIRPVAEQAARIAALREAAGDALVINARVDCFRGVEQQHDALPDGIARARAYLEAGADCVYPIHLRTAELVGEFTDNVGGHVNAPASAGSLAALAERKVSRISYGGGLWHHSRNLLADALSAIAKGEPAY